MLDSAARSFGFFDSPSRLCHRAGAEAESRAVHAAGCSSLAFAIPEAKKGITQVQSVTALTLRWVFSVAETNGKANGSGLV
ncbi:hypothetical protein GUJ93_ZPchr0013g34486 [Zizania palustris]|uniref:Uncharacterized protein n=1 Tax=Zizania palustris TaxID=103762 RepID=A0A8J6BXB1_ZIZPA|nr:hypothetical protein GUJ93_ZPchr0013g34486 [Zizania palustris]